MSYAIATKDISSKKGTCFIDTTGSIETHVKQSFVSWFDKPLTKQQINWVGCYINNWVADGRQLQAQDVEVADDGSPKLRKGVAKDRRISIEVGNS